jgi:hypothetical protein
VSLLRSSLILIIVSLSVFTAYAWDVLDHCCDDEKPVQVQTKAHTSSKAPGQSEKSDNCGCICHQSFTASSSEPVCATPGEYRRGNPVRLVDEFPPDSEPQGIEYPPQLA